MRLKVEFSNTTQLIGKRIIWRGVMYLLYALMFIVVSIWLFISIKATSNPDTFLITTFCLTVVISIMFLIIAVPKLLRRKDAIYVDLNSLIIRKNKDISISFTDIENIQLSFNKYHMGSRSYRNFSSGKIVITLKNNKIVYVDDIKDVENVCYSLRKIVLNK